MRERAASFPLIVRRHNMGYQHWKYETLHAFCMEAFEKFGFTEAEANIIQDVLLTSDLYGIESHGMQQYGTLSQVHRKGYDPCRRQARGGL